MSKLDSYSKVMALLSQGVAIRQIVRDTGVSRNTVRRLRDRVRDAGGEVDSLAVSQARYSKLDEFKPLIDQWMGQGLFNCVTILDRLRARGFDGGITIVRDYVHQFRPVRPRSTGPVRAVETGPGVQAQMDWGFCDALNPDGSGKKLACFVMVMSYSRALYVEFTQATTLEVLRGVMVRAFEFFGGVPDQVLTDNMRTCVKGRRGGQPVWNPGYASFAKQLGFTPVVHSPYHPQAKGKVERAVRYVKESFVPARSYTDLSDLNSQAITWCKQVNLRVHGTTRQVPAVLLGEEKLAGLPASGRAWLLTGMPRMVSRQGFVYYRRVQYGVPVRWACKQVILSADAGGKTLTIRDLSGQIVCTHNIVLFPHRPVNVPKQWDELESSRCFDPRSGKSPAFERPATRIEPVDLSIYHTGSGSHDQSRKW